MLIEVVIFDWGGTLMRDFKCYTGPMVNWPEVEKTVGVEQLMAQISNKYTCCVASNAGDSNAELMKRALARVSIAHYFHYFFTSEELGYKKPDVRFYQVLLARLGVEGKACVMVGDDYEKDIEPAARAGLKTILYNKECENDSYPAAAAVTGSLEGIPMILLKFTVSNE